MLLGLNACLPAAEPPAGDGLPPLREVGTVPGPGLRFRECDPLYAAAHNTAVTHCVYLPTDWKPGRRYPVLIEYAGNQYRGQGVAGPIILSGTCADARMGYYLSGQPGSPRSGAGCIWVTMPFIACDRSAPEDLSRHREAAKWYGIDTGGSATSDALGQRQAAEYLKRNLPSICQRYGGDPKRVVFCGFSRGAIAGGFIGRADDAVAALFCAFILHSHHDASGRPLSPPDPDGRRCLRARGRPSFLSAGELDNGHASTEGGAAALRAAKAEVELHIIPGIPHTDEWLFDRAYGTPAFAEARDAARRFLAKVVGPAPR